MENSPPRGDFVIQQSQEQLTDLDRFKLANYEKSERQGHIEYHGQLGGQTPSGLWVGNISKQQRLINGEINLDDVQGLKIWLPKLYVPTGENKGAAIRCIDGRGVKGYNDFLLEAYWAALGPQVPGGSLLQAVAYRIALGGDIEDYKQADMESDVATVTEATTSLGYTAGDHIDEQHGEHSTGCGAVDGVEQHSLNLYPAINEIEPATAFLLSSSYNIEHFDLAFANSARLVSGDAKYYQSKNAIVDRMIANNPASVPMLAGKHNELLVNVNYVPNTTLHTNHLNAIFDSRLQVFNMDAWHSVQVAQKLFENDPVKQSQYVHARVSLAVSALMFLTDGTVELATRTAP